MLAVNGNTTFLIYLYADDLMQWSSWDSNTGTVYALVGYNAGHGNISYTVPGSMSEEIMQITQRTNAGLPGMCVFQVDRADHQSTCQIGMLKQQH